MKWSLIATVLPYHPLWLGQKTCPKCNTKTSRCSLFLALWKVCLASLIALIGSSTDPRDHIGFCLTIYIYVICLPGGPYGEKLWPTASGSIFKTEIPIFLHTDWPLAGKEHIFFVKLNEILSERTRMIKGCKYCKIFHKLNNFWTSKW